MGSLSDQSPHVVIFPFMSKGHTIPLLHLARLLLHRHISVTVITTPLNSSSIRQYLKDTSASVIDLSFPQNVPQLPNGIESTDKLPSMSLFLPFANATKLMQPDFDRTLENLPRVSLIISDGFLGWTYYSGSRLGIPRLVFYGMNTFAMTISSLVTRDRPYTSVNSDDELFTIPSFPSIKFTKNDFEEAFVNPDVKGPHQEFLTEQISANMQSKGLVVNSFYELEAKFVDLWNTQVPSCKTWCVGPLCLAEPPKAQTITKPKYIQWLDERLTSGQSVLYVAFGTQADISKEQLQEIATGLERSEVSFLWLVRSKEDEVEEVLAKFEEKVKNRGLVVRDWVDQVEILSHKSVTGFMSHCGWNSVIESICESVPIIAWPMMADQHLNARMVVEELGVGIRVLARNGSVRGYVGSECIESMVKELMEGEKGKEVRKKVKEMEVLAKKAMEEGGSSWCTLGNLIQEMC
ncbi:Udp-glycosyltransferase 90a1 [Thalictrum thalictroides]|uniref:Glycosyltransferase n=1 Tax=Thalictrum thalictroides TaxID=46969 RepID=A0A7J6V9T1_THATH|nr:Udp-glycosyltransferase 90a1 [Thalictrum thalictroides]